MSSLSLLIVTGCGVFYPLYAAGPYKGKVIDTETKEPLEGAVVLAVWNKEYPSVGGRVAYFLDSEEVLTDSNGRFVVGKYPPVTLSLAFVTGPRIIIYHPGYASYGIYPDYRVSPKVQAVSTDTVLRMMEKEELTFELPRLTREERLYLVRSVDDPDVPGEKKRNLLRLRNIERKALGLHGDNEKGNIDTLVIMNGFPDEKQRNLLRSQYKNILIKENGRYFNIDGTPSGKIFESDLPVWVRELTGRMNYTFSLLTQISERPDISEENVYLPFCIKGTGSLVRTPDPIGKMHDFFLLNGWKASDRIVSDRHGSALFAYEKEKHHCRILFEIDETGIVPRKFGFEIYCREEGQK